MNACILSIWKGVTLGSHATLVAGGAHRMTTDTFRHLLAVRPFKPFRVVMSSGEAYDVRHPENAWLLRNDLLVGVDGEDDALPAEFRICPLFHVATIEPILPESSTG
jgi:hypothetical protein